MRGGANMGSPSSHLGIVDISTNTALGSDWHRGEMCSLNEPNSLEKMREMRRRNSFLAIVNLTQRIFEFFGRRKILDRGNMLQIQYK